LNEQEQQPISHQLLCLDVISQYLTNYIISRVLNYVHFE